MYDIAVMAEAAALLVKDSQTDVSLSLPRKSPFLPVLFSFVSVTEP